ncbi:MAG TPA: hypothetical protein VLB68_24855 [Pyrinomonadaceae bacterium]|nr:hypothetical protein [Pyrinomonadaceae bacterium]
MSGPKPEWMVVLRSAVFGSPKVGFRMSHKLKVIFDDPGDGWVCVKLSCGVEIADIIACYTPYDSFLDLVDALYNLFLYEGEWRVSWNEAPVECELRFRKTGNLVNFELLEFPDHRRELQRAESRLKAKGSYDEIAIPFWRALRNLQGRFSSEELHTRWHRAFPSKELEELTFILRSAS